MAAIAHFEPNAVRQDQPRQPGFLARYAELLAAVERRSAITPVGSKSFAWLIDRYRRSAEHLALADATQRDYVATLDLLASKPGDVQFAVATRAILKTVRDDYAETPRKPHKIKQMLSRLYSCADEHGMVPVGFNPAKAIRRLRPKGGPREIVVWFDAEIEMFLAVCPAHLRTPCLSRSTQAGGAPMS